MKRDYTGVENLINIEDAYDYIKANLKDGRYIHVLGVVSVAKKLAIINNVNVEKAEIAALSHDIAKNLSKNKMLEIIKDNNITLGENEKNTPALWHSIVGPILAKEILQIDDIEILDSIRWHTTGRANMTTLEKIIYISDMIEPSRIFKGVEKIREETLKDLDRGLLLGMDHSINYLLWQGSLLDIHTIEARNYLLLHRK